MPRFQRSGKGFRNYIKLNAILGNLVLMSSLTDDYIVAVY